MRIEDAVFESAKEKEISKVISLLIDKEGAYNIQNVNAYDSRLKNWMRHFKGAVAKYLESYLGWMRMLDRESDLTPQKILAMSVGWPDLMQIEPIFK